MCCAKIYNVDHVVINFVVLCVLLECQNNVLGKFRISYSIQGVYKTTMKFSFLLNYCCVRQKGIPFLHKSNQKTKTASVV